MSQADQNLLQLYRGLPESLSSWRWLKKYLNDRTINDIKTEKEGEDYYTSEKFFSFEKIVQKYSKKK